METREKDTVKNLIDAVAEYGLAHNWTDNDIIEALVAMGITKEDFIKYGKYDFAKGYFEE